jgi:hypothetical protein
VGVLGADANGAIPSYAYRCDGGLRRELVNERVCACISACPAAAVYRRAGRRVGVDGTDPGVIFEKDCDVGGAEGIGGGGNRGEGRGEGRGEAE